MYNMYIIYIYINRFFPFPTGGMGAVPRTSQKFTHSPTLPTKFLFPPVQKSIQPNKKTKTSFLAVVIAPVPFWF